VRRTDRATRARRIAGIACFALVAAAVAAPAGAEPVARDPEEAAVRRSFAVYAAALKNRDGARAVDAVSENSLRYYDHVRKLALSGTREELAALDGIERMLVLGMRRDAPIELLTDATPAGLVSHAVSEGLISDQGGVKTELGHVAVDGDVALAMIVEDDALTRGRLRFVREGEVWKFDLEYAMQASFGLIAALAKRSGMSEDEVIFRLLAQGTGSSPGPEIWTPLVAVAE
jgi:hypothetical protein